MLNEKLSQERRKYRQNNSCCRSLYGKMIGRKWRNPGKRDLVKSPEDWQWGSYRFYNGYDDYKIEMDEM